MNVNKHIIDQICEDFEYRTLVLEESELTAMKILCKEWSMTPFGEDTTAARDNTHGGDAAYMLWPYKLLVGKVRQSGWCGQVHPNNTLRWDSFKSIEQCNDTATGKIGCLFNVVDDPGEHVDLALTPKGRQIAQDIRRRMDIAQLEWFNPDRGQPDSRACSVGRHTGFWGPFLD